MKVMNKDKEKAEALGKTIKDLTGKKFNRLTVLEPTKKRSHSGVVIWKCQCDCGNIAEVRSDNLTGGRTQSCGCLVSDLTAKHNHQNTIHGDSHSSRIYRIWASMKSRCLNPNDYHYQYYGKRGIIVCNAWKNDYLAFKKWALANGYKPGLTIDRINNDGNYEPDNCQFLTRSENTRKAMRHRYRRTK